MNNDDSKDSDHSITTILSFTEFGAIMDEIEIELAAERLEIKYEYLMVSSLLFVDDISMVSTDIQQLKRC